METDQILVCVNAAIQHLQTFGAYQSASQILLDPGALRELRNDEFQAREDFFFSLN